MTEIEALAGTDTKREIWMDGPAIILAEPQLGQNIGTTARAMANFGLSDLRLVNPRDGWPCERAEAASSGATWVIEGARLFDTVEEAVADLNFVYATTARQRDLVKPVDEPEAAAANLRRRYNEGQKVGVLFGRERWGLNNDEIALSDAILTIPTNPGFSSLNLAQSVVVLGYTWLMTQHVTPALGKKPPPATKAELLGFFEHLETELDERGFLRPPEKKPGMVRNLRALFQRIQMTDQDVRTLRGVIKSLTHYDRSGRRRDDSEI